MALGLRPPEYRGRGLGLNLLSKALEAFVRMYCTRMLFLPEMKRLYKAGLRQAVNQENPK